MYVRILYKIYYFLLGIVFLLKTDYNYIGRPKIKYIEHICKKHMYTGNKAKYGRCEKYAV